MEVNENTTICWVPGHCQIKGNEEADRLAASGRANSRKLFVDVPGPDIRRLVRESSFNSFALTWIGEQGHIQKVKEYPGKWTDRCCQKEQRVLSRLRVGHTRVTHMHYLKRTAEPFCVACDTRLDVEHILVNCIEYDHLREVHNIQGSLREILSNDPVREKQLLHFLNYTTAFEALIIP